MSSPSLTGGSLYGILEFPASLRASKATEAISSNSKFICDEIPRSSRGMTQGLGILEFLNEFKI